MFGDNTGDPFLGDVSWDRCGDALIGVFHPGCLGILRIHLDGLRKVILRQAADEPLDCRLAALVEQHRRVYPQLSEVDVLIAVLDRLRQVLSALPERGGVIELPTSADQWLWGVTVLDICVAINAWLRSWYHGESVGGLPCPDEETWWQWNDQQQWLNSRIVQPLTPAS